MTQEIINGSYFQTVFFWADTPEEKSICQIYQNGNMSVGGGYNKTDNEIYLYRSGQIENKRIYGATSVFTNSEKEDIKYNLGNIEASNIYSSKIFSSLKTISPKLEVQITQISSESTISRLLKSCVGSYGSEASSLYKLYNSSLKDVFDNIKRCMAKKGSNGEVYITFMSPNCTNYYEDGSPAQTDGTEGDVMVYFDPFYGDMFNDGSDKIYYNFSKHEFDQSKKLGGYLIGAYRGGVKDGKMRSVSGIYGTDSTGIYTKAEMESMCSARGTGWRNIHYDMHKINVWLFYAWYNSFDSATLCGIGSSNSGSSSYYTGASNTTLGNKDSNEVWGSTIVNFLGMEGYWGGGLEFLSGITVNPGAINYKFRITDMYTNATRDIQGYNSGTNRYYVIKKMYGNSEFDIVPTDGETFNFNNEELKKYYCSLAWVANIENRVVMKGNSSGNAWASINYIQANNDASVKSSSYTCRLCYTGKINIVSPTEFKALPLIL